MARRAEPPLLTDWPTPAGPRRGLPVAGDPQETTASAAQFAVPAFVGLRLFTSSQDEDDTACQEHRRHNRCEIQVEPVRQITSCGFLHDRNG
jgi:hypothetical protein